MVMNQATGVRRRITVSIDADLRWARIIVLGLVTPERLRAVSVITKRAVTLLPVKEIIVDLSHARASAGTMEVCDFGQFLSASDREHHRHLPCTLRVLTPPPAAALPQEK